MKPIHANVMLKSLVFSRGPDERLLDHVKLKEQGDAIFRQGFPCDRRRVYIFRQDCKVVALLATVSTIVHSLAIVSILDGLSSTSIGSVDNHGIRRFIRPFQAN